MKSHHYQDEKPLHSYGHQVSRTSHRQDVNCSDARRSGARDPEPVHFSTSGAKVSTERCSFCSHKIAYRWRLCRCPKKNVPADTCRIDGDDRHVYRRKIEISIKSQRRQKDMILKLLVCFMVQFILLNSGINHGSSARFCHIAAFNPSHVIRSSRTRRKSSDNVAAYNSLHDTQKAAGRSKSTLFSTKSDQANDSSQTKENPTHINPAATPSLATNNEYSFFDEATIYIRAGSGGQGASTYRKGVNNQNGPPDGGNGGKGGNVVLMMDESLNTLAGLARYAWRPNAFGGGGGAKRRGDGDSIINRVLTFRAEPGADGGRRNKQGRNGKDVVVRVPPGTVVQEEFLLSPGHAYGDKEVDGEDSVTYKDIGTITLANPTLTIATGGQGGEGSAINGQRGVRRPRNSPQGGERKRVKLTLKVVADVALVAVPNAGKSTLLSKVTRAKPKIADYPFTTVVPNLGVWVPSRDFDLSEEEEEYEEDGSLTPSHSKSLILCDVPGLIAGASDGVGLGHAFLRHVERCHVILHLLDATSEKVLEEYAMINKELLRYGTGKLAQMPQVVVVNKVDVAFAEENGAKEARQKELEEKLKEMMPHSRLMWISAKEGEGVDDLMERVAMFVKKVKDTSAKEEMTEAAQD